MEAEHGEHAVKQHQLLLPGHLRVFKKIHVLAAELWSMKTSQHTGVLPYVGADA